MENNHKHLLTRKALRQHETATHTTTINESKPGNATLDDLHPIEAVAYFLYNFGPPGSDVICQTAHITKIDQNIVPSEAGEHLLAARAHIFWGNFLEHHSWLRPLSKRR